MKFVRVVNNRKQNIHFHAEKIAKLKFFEKVHIFKQASVIKEKHSEYENIMDFRMK